MTDFPENEILRTVAGSRVLGLDTPESDHDEIGVFIENPEQVLGLSGAKDTVVGRSKPEGERSDSLSIDRTWHSLRKYLYLATKGNPNFLLPLYCPQQFIEYENQFGYELRALAPRIVSKSCIFQTVGYLNGQLKRLDEGRGKRFPNRPELIEKHGYDTKYAGHALRLAIQAFELASTGRLTLPMGSEWRRMVRDVREGVEPDKEAVIAEVRWWEKKAVTLVESGSSQLPNKPDFEAVNEWMISAHRRQWKWRRQG